MKKILFFLSIVAFNVSNGQIITTIAGRDTLGYGGDNGPATAAFISLSYGIAADTLGNIYFTDGDNYRIRKINTYGIITTIAGTGIEGHTGDGGPATAARIGITEGIAIDKNENIYFTESDLNSVRKINTSGIITTISGTGTVSSGYSGDGGPATAALLNFPWSVAIDRNNNLYIADYENNVIRKIDISGIITTFAGNHTLGSSGDGGPATNAELYQPINVIADTSNNIYIATSLSIRKVNIAGIISTFAGNGIPGFSGDGGMATDAEMENPTGLCMDKYGNLFFTDIGLNRIRLINTVGIITTVAGTGISGYSGDGGSPLYAELNEPTGICIYADSLYFVDSRNYVIRKISGLSQLSISETKIPGLKFYPNPSSGLLYVELPEYGTKSVSYWITDILGKEIKTGEIKEKLTAIDLRNFEQNIYYLKVLMGNKIYTQKIIGLR